MKKILVILLFTAPVFANAQLHLNFFGGISNYQGDLQGKALTVDQSSGAAGISLSYDLSRHFAVRGGLFYGRVAGDDKQNKVSLQPRNLNFATRITEGNLLLEYNLFDLEERKFTPYAFAGIALYHFNPYTSDSIGVRYFLQPLGTEGQGLDAYPNRKPYPLTQFAFPFGGGLKLRLNENLVLGYEIGMRKLFTDYLDDVSTTYVDEGTLAAAKGPTAVRFSYRGGELKNGEPAYPVAGTIRGGAKSKDWYYFQGITLRIRLHHGLRRGQRFGCPPAF